MKKSGKILLSAELGREYGFKDVGGNFHQLWTLRVLVNVFAV